MKSEDEVCLGFSEKLDSNNGDYTRMNAAADEVDAFDIMPTHLPPEQHG